MTPTTSEAITEPIHSSRLSLPSGVMPFGQPRPSASDQLHPLSSSAVPPRSDGQCHQLQPASGHVGASWKRRIGTAGGQRLQRILRSVDHPAGVSEATGNVSASVYVGLEDLTDSAYWRGVRTAGLRDRPVR